MSPLTIFPISLTITTAKLAISDGVAYLSDGEDILLIFTIPSDCNILVAVGPGARDDKGNHIPLDVKEGDRVIYGKFGGVDLKYDNEEYIVLSEKDILVVLD